MTTEAVEDNKRVQEYWRPEEIDIILSYLGNSWTPTTLCMKIQQISPHRTPDAIMRKMRHMKVRGGYLKPKERLIANLHVGYFDIEATDLDAEFGTMICWCIKDGRSDRIDSACITRKEATDKHKLDKRIIGEFWRAVDKYDLLFVHWGKNRRFDFPFCRTRAIYWGLQGLLPERGTKFMSDTYDTARNKLKLKRNRLDNIAKFIQAKDSKTYLDPIIWSHARFGDQSSLDYIFEHCRADVLVLEQVRERIACVEDLKLISI